MSKIKLLPEQVCPYCEKNITDAGLICPHCRSKFLAKNDIIPLDSLTITTSYKDGNVSRLIHLYKYNFITDLSVPLGQLLIKNIIKNNIPLADSIIPVPLHPRRLRWRGFNQSELLSDFISVNLTPGFNIPVFSDLIKRARYTRPQMKIKNYKERQQNMRNIFALNPYININKEKIPNSCYSKKIGFLENKNILLVDDICTTGATLFEAGRILKQSGAKRVMGVVLARQEIV